MNGALSGPGKLTEAFAITNRHHEMNLCLDPPHCSPGPPERMSMLSPTNESGITRSAHHPWDLRFGEANSSAFQFAR